VQIAEVKRKAEAQRERLEGLRVALLKRKDLLRLTVSDKNLKLQAKRSQLQDHNMHISLEREEAKLRKLMSDQHQMDDFIKSKESETNYKSLALQIGSLADELNTVIKKSVLL
jgi:intraflagellar transport protein 74